MVRQKARVGKAEQRALTTLRKVSRSVPPDPRTAVRRARSKGTRMTSGQVKAFKLLHGEGAWAEVKRAQRSYVRKQSDDLGEPGDLIAAVTLAVPGGGLIGAAGKKAAQLGAKAVAKKTVAGKTKVTAAKGLRAGSGVKATSGGRTLTEKGLKAAKRPSRRARNLAAHESGRAAMRASRRIRPKAAARVKVKGRRVSQRTRLRYGKEGRKVARRTRAVKLGVNAPLVASTGAGVGIAGVVGADIGGHVRATVADPAGVLKRTLEIAPGLVVSTADLAAQAAVALGTGDTKGLRRRISEDFGFAKELYAVMTSGDEARVKRFVAKHGLIAPLLLTPTVARGGSIAKRGTTVHPTRPRETDMSNLSLRKRARTRQRWRQRLSRDAARAQGVASAEKQAAGAPVIRAYTGRRGRKGVKGRRQLADKSVDRGDVMALVAEEGLKRGPRVAENFEAVARKWGKRPIFADKRKGGVSGHDLIAYVRRDPGVWQDKAFWRTVAAYRKQEPAQRLSERVVDIEQAKTHGVRLAEDRPPPLARELIPGIATRADVEAYVGKGGKGGKRVGELRRKIRSREGRARELRAELRQLEKQERARSRAVRPTKSQIRELAALRALERRGKTAPQPRRGLRVVSTKELAPSAGRKVAQPALAITKRRRRQLLDAEADVRGLRAELRSTEKRHKAIRSSLRDPAESAAVKQEFDVELAAVRGDKDLVRGAFVPHLDIGREGIPVAQPITRVGKKIYKRDVGAASLAERGRVDFSLPAIIQAGIEAPIIRRELHAFTDQAVREGLMRFRDRKTGKVKRIGTREQLERGLSAEQKAEGVLFPLSQFKQAIREDDVGTLTQIVDGLGSEIAAVEGKPRQKYGFLDRDYAAELKAQLSAPGSVLHKAQIASRGVSRAILSSPAWVAGQVLAEGFQALHAINPLNPFNIGHFYQGYVKGVRGLDPAARRAYRAEAGFLPGMGLGPREFATIAGKTHRGLASNFRKLERVLPLKRLIQAVRLDWIKATDRAKGGELRVMVKATKDHKDAMGFGKRLERLVTDQRKLSEKLAAMSPSKRLEWMTKDTAAKRRNLDYLDDVMGNWTAFSRREKVFAPMAIFYNFLRMSMQWPFYTFPKHHPARASVMYALAASHNNQIRELLGGPPAWFGEYATAIVYGEEGGRLFKATRIIPGAGPVMEALATGADVSAQRILNPIAGYFNALINGIDPLSGDKVDPKYLSAEERFIARAGLTLSLLFNTFPPARAADQARGAKPKTSLPLVGKRYEKSALGDLVKELGGSPSRRVVQTLFNPIPSADFDKTRDKAAMGRIFNIWRKFGSDAQAAVKKDKSLNERQKEKKLKMMKGRSDEASSELKRLYNKYEVVFRKEERESLDEWSRLTFLSGDSGGGGQYSGEGAGQYSGAGEGQYSSGKKSGQYSGGGGG